MVTKSLFTPVSFVRADVEEIQYAGGSLVLFGRNGVGKSYFLEEVASSLQGEVVGRAEPGYGMPEYEGSIGVIARLKEDVSPEDIEVLQSPPGQYPNHQVGMLRQAIESFRSQGLPSVKGPEVDAVVGDVLDEFAALRYVFLALLPLHLGPGWRLHAAAIMSPEKRAVLGSEGQEFRPIQGDDVSVTYLNQDPYPGALTIPVASYRFNGYKPHVVEFPQPLQTVFDRVINEAQLDSAATTAEWVKDTLIRSWDQGVVPDGSIGSLRTLADEWVARANAILPSLLANPPELSLKFGKPSDWLMGRPPAWSGLENLGFAERRWAQVAIALTSETDDSPYLIVDEPERGLHRSAEAYLAEGLRHLTRERGVRLIAATHSPEFIDTDFGQLIHLERTEGGGIGHTKELSRADIEELRSVSLQPTSLLGHDRGYLLVEGEHDKQILEGYFADDLHDLKVKILRMRGSKNLASVFDSEFLINASDALLMPLLDDVSLDPLYDLWAAAEAAASDGRPSAAVDVIQSGITKIPGKAKAVYEPFLIGVVTRGQGRRFLPLGMSKRDVLEYLPVTELVHGATSWEDLRQEWSRSPNSGQDPSRKAYQDWLRSHKHADLTPESLRFVAETNMAPPELKAIIARIAERLDPTASRWG